MTSKILPKVFGWMFIGLLVTFFTGYYVSLHPETMFKLFGSYAFLIVIIIEFRKISITCKINNKFVTCLRERTYIITNYTP